MRTKINQWINEDIDGVIRPADKRKLDRILESEPEFREIADELKAMNHSLSELGELSPPEGLKKRIMNSLEPHKIPSKHKSVHRFKSGLRFSYIFAMGAVATLLIMALVLKDQNPVWIAPTGDHVGAIGLDKYKTFPIIEKIQVESKGVTGTVFVRQMNTISALEISLQSGSSFDVKVSYLPEVIGFDMYKPLSGGTVTLKTGEDHIKLIGGESGKYLLLFGGDRPRATSLTLSIEQQGSVLFNRTISVNRTQ